MFDALEIPGTADTPIIEEVSAPLHARLTMPFFLFSASLTLLLLASQFFLLPRLSTVEVGGKRRTYAELQQYKAELTTAILEGEEARTKQMLPIRDPVFLALKDHRHATLPYERFAADILAQAKTAGESVMVNQILYTPAEKSAQVEGDIEAGMRSITVLASFTDFLRHSTLIGSLLSPSFARIDGEHGPHSPFSISLTLR